MAVKRMRVEHVRGELTKFGNRAEKEFLSEAEVIVRVHHRHLLPLIGYCSTRDERILILMYMEKGTLEAKLQGELTLGLDPLSVGEVLVRSGKRCSSHEEGSADPSGYEGRTASKEAGEGEM